MNCRRILLRSPRRKAPSKLSVFEPRVSRRRIGFIVACVTPLVSGCTLHNGSNVPGQLDVEVKEASQAEIDRDTARASAAMYHYMVGQLAYEGDDVAAALDNFARASALVPEGSKILSSRLIELYVRGGELDKALAESDRILAQNPDDPPLLMMRAGILDALKRSQEAEPIYIRLIEAHPTIVDSYLLLSSLYSESKAYDKAIAVLRKLVDRSPKEPLGHYFLARVYQNVEDPASAERSLRRARELNPENAEINAELVRVLLQAKKFDAAKEICNKILERDPGNVFARRVLGQLLIGESRFDEALEHLQALEKVEDDSAETRFKIALIQIGRQNLVEAVRELNLVLASNPEHREARYYLASVYAGTGRSADAVTELLKVPPGELYVKARLFAAVLLRQEKQFERAEEVLREALDSGEERATLVSYLVLVLRDRQRLADAEELLVENLALEPKNEKLLFSYATVLHDLGRDDDALPAMERLLEVNPANSDALNFIAYQLADSGVDLDRALKLVQQAIESRPNDGYYLDTLGWVHFRRGTFEEACKILARAAAVVEDDLIIGEHYGDSLIKCGQAEKALEVFRRAAGRVKDPRDSETEAAHRRIVEKISRLEKELGAGAAATPGPSPGASGAGK